jgi:hypothetical protein
MSRTRRAVDSLAVEIFLRTTMAIGFRVFALRYHGVDPLSRARLATTRSECPLDSGREATMGVHEFGPSVSGRLAVRPLPCDRQRRFSVEIAPVRTAGKAGEARPRHQRNKASTGLSAHRGPVRSRAGGSPRAEWATTRNAITPNGTGRPSLDRSRRSGREWMGDPCVCVRLLAAGPNGSVPGSPMLRCS